MATITFKGHPTKTSGVLPPVGISPPDLPDFELVRRDLSVATLQTYSGKKKLLNIFPSLDTGVCARSVKSFAALGSLPADVIVLNISKDLPFAHARFCTHEHLSHIETLSAYRSTFARDYGLEIIDGPIKALCSRAVIVLDESNRVLHTEQVPEITQEPSYEAALAAILTAAKS